MPARMTCTVGASSCALAVGTRRWPARTKSSSAKISRKLGKGMADGRGAAAEALGGPGDARINEERVEDDEKVGVDFLEMHGR